MPLFDFNCMLETDEWRNQMATLQISNSSLLWKHPECFISTELSQWNILHHSHLWSRRAIKQDSTSFVSAGEDQSSSWRIGSWLGWMKTPSMERHQLFWLADFMPCTSRWPLIGCPYCSPVTLRKMLVPTCLKRTSSSRSQKSPSHCTAQTSRSSPSPFSPKALTSCRQHGGGKRQDLYSGVSGGQRCRMFIRAYYNWQNVPPSDLVIRQGRAEVVWVEVSASLHVCDADALTTLDGHPALAWLVGLPANLPVTVGIICVLDSSYRLLSTTCKRVKSKTAEQLKQSLTELQRLVVG